MDMDQNAVILSDVRTQTRLRVRRGDIWYISPGTTVGSEQHSGRPAVVVSSDAANAHSMTVEVVYFTTQPKRDMPTHVTIRSINRESTALCEQITTVSIERLGTFVGRVSDDEMDRIERALLASLDLDKDLPAEDADSSFERFVEIKAKYEILQQMYDSLLDKLVCAG